MNFQIIYGYNINLIENIFINSEIKTEKLMIIINQKIKHNILLIIKKLFTVINDSLTFSFTFIR